MPHDQSIRFINLRAPTSEIPSRLKTGRAEHIVCTVRVSILITQGGNPILIILHLIFLLTTYNYKYMHNIIVPNMAVGMGIYISRSIYARVHTRIH